MHTEVTLLTAGRDPHYAYGLAKALASRQVYLDLIGGDGLISPEWDTIPYIRFKNIKGDASSDASLAKKVVRIFMYYWKLVAYAATSQSTVFHILWNNKFEVFDRVVLMGYYRLLGKKPVLTVHNVNAGIRDCNDSFINRLTLRIQYSLSGHLFVHTEKMKHELMEQFSVPAKKVSVIPFGINNAVPETPLTPQEARRKLGLGDNERVMLFYGHIAPYKGLEYLIEALKILLEKKEDYRLILAGNPKNCPSYWGMVRKEIDENIDPKHMLERIQHIPDEETEVYFKAADVMVLPYRHIYQSGVLFLGYSFGLPVIATDVGALKEDVLEGQTGFMCKPEDPNDLAKVIETYFASGLYKCLNDRRPSIRNYAHERHSWDTVAQLTLSAYKNS